MKRSVRLKHERMRDDAGGRTYGVDIHVTGSWRGCLRDGNGDWVTGV
jgi:hypothetical protein